LVKNGGGGEAAGRPALTRGAFVLDDLSQTGPTASIRGFPFDPPLPLKDGGRGMDFRKSVRATAQTARFAIAPGARPR